MTFFPTMFPFVGHRIEQKGVIGFSLTLKRWCSLFSLGLSLLTSPSLSPLNLLRWSPQLLYLPFSTCPDALPASLSPSPGQVQSNSEISLQYQLIGVPLITSVFPPLHSGLLEGAGTLCQLSWVSWAPPSWGFTHVEHTLWVVWRTSQHHDSTKRILTSSNSVTN